MPAVTETEGRVLVECYKRQQALASTPEPARGAGHYRSRCADARQRLDWQDEQEYGPRYSTGVWFGEFDNAASQRYTRAVKALHQMGLAVGTLGEGGGRLTFLRLTAKGKKLARTLIAAEETGGHPDLTLAG